MKQLSEYEARQSERYKAMRKQLNDLHPGLAAYITIAGVLMIVSGFFWGGGEDGNPMFTAGIGLAALLGGGGYWFHCKEKEKRLSRELSSIETHFASKNKRINWNGDVSEGGS